MNKKSIMSSHLPPLLVVEANLTLFRSKSPEIHLTSLKNQTNNRLQNLEGVKESGQVEREKLLCADLDNDLSTMSAGSKRERHSGGSQAVGRA